MIAILEALVFASESPLTPERAVEVLTDADRAGVLALFEALGQTYDARGGGIQLVQVAGGFQFRTRPDMAPWIRKLKAARPAMLSTAALETLAVIAYRQPIVKADIDRVRGVDASGALKGLLEKKIVRIVGRKDVPGKPIIYGTTKKFLEVFNLRDLTELPTLRDLKDLQDDGAPVNLELPNILEDQEGQGGRGTAAFREPLTLPDAIEPREEDDRARRDGTAAAAVPGSHEPQGDGADAGRSGAAESRGEREPQDNGPGPAERSEAPVLPDSEATQGSDGPADYSAPSADNGPGPADDPGSPTPADSEVPRSGADERQE